MVACEVGFTTTIMIQISGKRQKKSTVFSKRSNSHLLVLLVFGDQIVHVALSLTKKSDHLIEVIGHKLYCLTEDKSA